MGSFTDTFVGLEVGESWTKLNLSKRGQTLPVTLAASVSGSAGCIDIQFSLNISSAYPFSVKYKLLRIATDFHWRELLYFFFF